MVLGCTGSRDHLCSVLRSKDEIYLLTGLYDLN